MRNIQGRAGNERICFDFFIIKIQEQLVCKNQFFITAFGMAMAGIRQFDHKKQIKIRNSQKPNEIQILKREVDLYALSSRLQTLNKEQTCKQCIRKDQQIETLIKALKALRSTVSNSRESLKILQEKGEEEPSKISSSNKNQGYFELSQGSYYIFQRNEDEAAKSQSKNIFSPERQPFQILKLQSQNKVFLQEIEALRKKLELCEKKASILQQINKTLRRQCQRKSSEIGHTNLTINNFKIKEAATIEEISHDDIRKRLPTFSSVRANVTKQTIVRPPEIRQAFTPRSNLLQQTLASRNTQRRNQYPRRYRSRDEELVEERKKSLDHKIKILQAENNKLRKQVYRINY